MATITARYDSICPACGSEITTGDRVEWSKGAKARHTACPAGASPRIATKPRTRRAPSAPPVGPELRNDNSSYTVGDVLVAQLSANEVAECEARQAISATGVPGDKPIRRAGNRRVAVAVIHASRISQEWADDNGYCGRYGAILRLATADEAAPLLAERQEKAKARAEAEALEAVWQAQIVGLTAARCYVDNVDPETSKGAEVIHEERRGAHGSISARWSRLTDGSVMHESFSYDDHRCGKYGTGITTPSGFIQSGFN